MEVNEKCDMYSFGVLALEILFGKQPSDVMSSSWIVVASTLDNMSLLDKLDQRLPHPIYPIVNDLLSIARIAIGCLNESPRSRPTMKQVVKELVLSK
ncbi:MDIS1-interacting receptor like kinase 2-like [Gastrolobium bilobum]|uniref:MDIS1-interacting receptor like kinase 2-like n=1 Tax=Gastrolobium bilobum TaxID=150636 RepID=UPI002AAF812B|nr:MDIS1-interacting receptor like kinase 2-like [Gastrolobium bilobum]